MGILARDGLIKLMLHIDWMIYYEETSLKT